MLVVLLKKQTTTLKLQITTPEFSTLAAGVFNASLEQANLVRKIDFENTISILDSKIATDKTKQRVY